MKEASTLKGKRRRDITPHQAKDIGSKTVAGSAAISTPVDLWEYEWQEVERRDTEKDFVIFKDTCKEIGRLMKDILILKTQRKSEAEVNEKRIQVSMLFITLKKLNRLEKLRSKKARDATNETKQQVDNCQLQLQNLLYEDLHLKKEVDKCKEFKSTDEEIQLVSVEEFYREAPRSISKSEVTKNNEHQLMLARLDWELEQRKQLAKKYEEAKDKKEVVLMEIKRKQEKLDKLAPHLRALLQAAKPLESNLDVTWESTRILNKTARYLPSPLFVLYVQTNAYREACDSNITVTINGNVEDVRTITENREEDREEDSGDSDQEDAEGEERHRKSDADRLESSRKQLLQKHPLTIAITIIEGKNKLCLHFTYLLALQIVTVNCSLISTSSSVNTGDVFLNDTLLTCLFSNDFGENTPNHANHYQLQKLGMNDFPSYIAELGHPYLWAQHLAGLTFLPVSLPQGSSESSDSTKRVLSDSKISSTYVEKTIKALHNRFKARLSLHDQIAYFGQGTVATSSQIMPLFPPKIASRLTSWKLVILEEHVDYEQRMDLIEKDIYIPGSLLYQALVQRGSAKLNALILISPDYPSIPPFFMLKVNWKYERTSSNDDALLALEQELNVHHDELIISGHEEELLTNQVQRLLMCFDIYLETEVDDASVEGPLEFPKEKIFLKAHRGRDRSRPYRYLSSRQCFIQR